MAGTGAAVPSDAILDLKENAKTLDEFTSSNSEFVVGRITTAFPSGKNIRTLTGINAVFDAAQAGQFVADSEAAADRAEAAADVAMTAGWVYATNADGEAARVDGDYFWVVSADSNEVLELWLMGATTATDTGKRTTNSGFILEAGKNLVHRIRRGFRYFVSGGEITAAQASSVTDFIPVVAGQTYAISGAQPNLPIGAFEFDTDSGGNPERVLPNTSNDGFAIITIPAGKNFLVVSVTNDASWSFEDTIMVERGSIVTKYEPHNLVIKENRVPALSGKAAKADVFSYSKKNKLDLTKVNFSKRWADTGTDLTLIDDSSGLAASDWISVVEGKTYAFTGVSVSGYGVYFGGYGSLKGISRVTVEVIDGGYKFTVPTEQGITHVAFNLAKLNDDPSATELKGVAQLEYGEVGTVYEAFTESKSVKPEFIPEYEIPEPPEPVTINNDVWYKYVEGDSGSHSAALLPEFRKNWLTRDKDLCVVNIGTSITARTVEHCTDHPNATARPPLMHSNNLASIIWDRIKWDGQEYRRYDSGYYTETGAFATDFDLTEWDDGARRNGLTRWSETADASVSFAIPVDAWQFNFIYRTDSLGCDAQVTIAEGNGLVQVYDENTESWVEANGYILSMFESTPTTATYSIPDARDSNNAPQSVTCTTKANTTYQKRLKMRCRGYTPSFFDSRGSVKNATIAAATAGRFMYWGVEWSFRQYMITYINAARGGWNTAAESPNGLPTVADNEVFGFKPDLIFSELPIHNGNPGAGGIQSIPNKWFYEYATNNYVFNINNPLSLVSRASAFGLAPEIGMFTSTFAENFGTINPDGSLVTAIQDGGTRAKMVTSLDRYAQAVNWWRENHPESPIIHATQRWYDAGVAIFGNMYDATVASGRDGLTFTNEGGHPNDTGCKVLSKVILPTLTFAWD